MRRPPHHCQTLARRRGRDAAGGGGLRREPPATLPFPLRRWAPAGWLCFGRPLRCGGGADGAATVGGGGCTRRCGGRRPPHRCHPAALVAHRAWPVAARAVAAALPLPSPPLPLRSVFLCFLCSCQFLCVWRTASASVCRARGVGRAGVAATAQEAAHFGALVAAGRDGGRGTWRPHLAGYAAAGRAPPRPRRSQRQEARARGGREGAMRPLRPTSPRCTPPRLGPARPSRRHPPPPPAPHHHPPCPSRARQHRSKIR